MSEPVRKGRRADPAKDEAIIAAARDLFTARGYSVTIDEVAAAACVSKQTIYARYASKQELFEGVVHQTAEELVQPLAVGSESPEVALTAFGARYVEVVFNEQKLATLRLLISEASNFPELSARYYQRGPKFVRDRLAAYIASAAAAGKLTVDNAALAASQFVGLILGGDHLAALMGVESQTSSMTKSDRVKSAVAAFMEAYRAH